MSKLMIALFVTAGLGFAGAGAAQMNAPDDRLRCRRTSYTQAKKDADAQYKIDKDACSSLCAATPRTSVSRKPRARTTSPRPTPKPRTSTRRRRARTRVSRTRKRATTSPSKNATTWPATAKDVCVKEAKSELVKGKANAKVDRVAADTNKDAATKQAEARKDASADKRDADYKVAIEKCDALAGAAKDACVSNAKAQFGKT